ncbi:MAG: hypothetical protein L0241_01710 [Planctomycetia bacterium]|nr:hypothetical protein [Planctomycetia bacterium]
MVTGLARRVPVHWMSWTGFITAILAGVLALYGSMQSEKHIANSPLRQARGASGLPAQPGPWHERAMVKGETSIFGEQLDNKLLALTERSKIANYSLQIFAYFLPFVLGLIAALTGGAAMKAVERSNGRYIGNALGVFAIMIGGLATVVAGCMILSIYIWPWMPSLYT